jgi:hypothetical protein
MVASQKQHGGGGGVDSVNVVVCWWLWFKVRRGIKPCPHNGLEPAPHTSEALVAQCLYGS